MLRLLDPGDHVLIGNDFYGGTYRLLSPGARPRRPRLHARRARPSPSSLAAWQPSTRMVWVETPSNPLLRIADIAALAELAHARDALLVVDNTFATPYLQRPLALGADMVVHSTTKYLGGHSDVVGGFVATSDDAAGRTDRLPPERHRGGPGPLRLLSRLRGVKTLAVRMDRHCDNAARVAEMLAAHPAVERVYYPGLPEHEGHDTARRQMRGFGGMVSFTVRGGEARRPWRWPSRTSVFTLAESLGAVESLIEHPARMTHASLSGFELGHRSRAAAAFGRHREHRRPAGRSAGCPRRGTPRLSPDSPGCPIPGSIVAPGRRTYGVGRLSPRPTSPMPGPPQPAAPDWRRHRD